MKTAEIIKNVQKGKCFKFQSKKGKVQVLFHGKELREEVLGKKLQFFIIVTESQSFSFSSDELKKLKNHIENLITHKWTIEEISRNEVEKFCNFPFLI